jgi:hypothetical protein
MEIKSKDILSYISYNNKKSYGQVGEIYLFNKNDNNYIIKKQPLSSRFYYETEFHKLIHKLVSKNNLKHFANYHKSFKDKKYGYILMDNIQHDLINLFTNKITYPEFESFVFQIIYTLLEIKNTLRGCHNDIKYSNIMYDTTKQEFIDYTINGETFRIKTFGRIFKIIDYGRIRTQYLSDDKSTRTCINKFSDLKQLSNLINDMYYLELINNETNINKILELFNIDIKYIDIYFKIIKYNINKSQHDKIHNIKRFLIKLQKKNIFNLEKHSKLKLTNNKINDFLQNLYSYKNYDINILSKLFEHHKIK